MVKEIPIETQWLRFTPGTFPLTAADTWYISAVMSNRYFRYPWEARKQESNLVKTPLDIFPFKVSSLDKMIMILIFNFNNINWS